MELHPEILSKDGEKHFAVFPYVEFLALQERLSDLEDLLELRKAKRTEGRKRAIPLETARAKLGVVRK